MAHAVEQWADHIYLTSDNPRSEDPEAIIAEVRTGFTPGIWESRVWCDPDRARAIARVVADARAGDAVLLCGKGHEESQDIAGVLHRFSDRDVAAQALAASGHQPPVSPPGGGGR
jgi:UDP-N-acetylmuramoyl-L-alanyl-D-glutamate--2,6-diaminopimelate ligase